MFPRNGYVSICDFMYMVKNYIKSCSDKCTPFIICYLIQFILKWSNMF
jgi:uroporphyrinogen-III decarboxylase